MMKCFVDKAKVLAIEEGRDPDRTGMDLGGGEQCRGVRCSLRKAARGGEVSESDARGSASSDPRRYDSQHANPQPPTTSDPRSWHPSGSATSSTWEEPSAKWKKSPKSWEDRSSSRWDASRSDQWSSDQGHQHDRSKGSGSKGWSSDNNTQKGSKGSKGGNTGWRW
jgi:hypothetical protein